MKSFLSRRVLVGVPAILVLVIVAGLIGRGVYSSRTIANKYRIAAREAIDRNDMEKAKFYYSRLVSTGEKGTPRDQLNMVAVLDASGDGEAAKDLLNELAPDDTAGYSPAHKQKAAMLYRAIAQDGPSKAMLERLHWHLKHGAKDQSVQSDVMWANYYLTVEQFSKAAVRLDAAASKDPDHWFEISNLYRRMGRKDDARRAAGRAETRAREQLKKDPLDTRQRLRLADVLMMDEKPEEVRAILKEGLRLAPDDPAIRRAASNYALVTMGKVGTEPDSELSEKDKQRRQFRLLSEAIKIDPKNQAVYSALSALYAGIDSETTRKSYLAELRRWITEGLEVPYAHFTLGNLLFTEEDQDGAIFHLEKAFEMDPSLSIVANNLAWVLSHSDQPDLDRAEQLIRTVIDETDSSLRFADTFAAVLFKQKKYNESLNQYEKILPKTAGAKRIEVHERLAEIYDQLGQPEMAESHRDRIAEMTPQFDK